MSDTATNPNTGTPETPIESAKRIWDSLTDAQRSAYRFASYESVLEMLVKRASSNIGGEADPNVIPVLDANAHLMMFRELNRIRLIREAQNQQIDTLLNNVLGAHANAIPR